MSAYRPSVILAHLLTLIAILVTLYQSRENARMISSNRDFLEAMSPKVAEMWRMKERGITNKDAFLQPVKAAHGADGNR